MKKVMFLVKVNLYLSVHFCQSMQKRTKKILAKQTRPLNSVLPGCPLSEFCFAKLLQVSDRN
jgi:hypothetical protein